MNIRPLNAVVMFVLIMWASPTLADEQDELFRRLDADRDLQITRGEISKENTPLFQRLIRKADSNKDGQLSAKEWKAGLTSTRPEKPITEKADSELPGADALLLVLAWMDENADLTITSAEVLPEMQPLFDEFVEVANLKNRDRLPVPQLKQQSIRYLGISNRFIIRHGIDPEVELALLNDKQAAYVERLRTSLRPGSMMKNPENAMMLFSELDTNGDGNVTADEVPAPYEDRFADLLQRADRNQDKQLSEQEFKSFSKRLAGFAANRPPLAETNQRVQEILKRSDRDRDGQLSRQEAPPRMAQRFKRLDQNRDGQLDSSELSRAVEILATLRNSAGLQPASMPLSDEAPKKNRKK